MWDCPQYCTRQQSDFPDSRLCGLVDAVADPPRVMERVVERNEISTRRLRRSLEGLAVFVGPWHCSGRWSEGLILEAKNHTIETLSCMARDSDVAMRPDFGTHRPSVTYFSTCVTWNLWHHPGIPCLFKDFLFVLLAWVVSLIISHMSQVGVLWVVSSRRIFRCVF
jgi:hypothetical protein